MPLGHPTDKIFKFWPCREPNSPKLLPRSDLGRPFCGNHRFFGLKFNLKPKMIMIIDTVNMISNRSKEKNGLFSTPFITVVNKWTKNAE